MSDELVCNVCDPKGVRISRAETAVVRPNIRRLQNERFNVWRCPRCRSIHAADEVDLDAYYRDSLSCRCRWIGAFARCTQNSCRG